MHSILNNHHRRLLDELNRNNGGPDERPVTVEEKGYSLGRTMQLEERRIQTCISPMEHNNYGERVNIGISEGNWKQTFFLQFVT